MAARKAAPQITDAQRAFVKASEEAETARFGKERAQLRRTARLLWMVASLVLLWFGYVLWKDYDVARREINVFTARAAEALNDEHFERAIRYALQAYPARGHLPWITPTMAHLIQHFSSSPRFFFTATQGSSGKTAATQVSYFFVQNPIMATESGAGLIRRLNAMR